MYGGKMAGETMADLFRSLLKTSKKGTTFGSERGAIGILSFEIASLMSKLANLWHCLEDKEILRLREELTNSMSIKMFVSENVDYLMDLALKEVMENVGCVARAVVVLGERCADPTYHHLKPVFDDPLQIDLKWGGWEYRIKKMDRKVKKMERFVAATSQLYQELEVLAELEQTLRRMRANPDLNQVKLFEFQQKVMWQRQEVKNLREMSPWIRTYDYIVRLLLRSIFSILARIKLVYETVQKGAVDEVYDCLPNDQNSLVRSNSFSGLLQSPINPSQSYSYGFQSAHVGRSFSNLGMAGEKNRPKCRNSHTRKNSFVFGGKQQGMKTIGFAHVGPFKGCMTGGDSPVLSSFSPSSSDVLRCNGDMSTMKCLSSTNFEPVTSSGAMITTTRLFLPNFNHKIINPPSSTLGHAALSLRYANTIILIERLMSSPHLISEDARDDLYNMLPTSIRASLRRKLKVFTKTFRSSVYDAALAAEWRLISSRILDWLLPLAHGTMKWYSERNFEKQHMTPGTDVLLVQTLYFADQAKAEATITELLMGLNYLSRYYKEHKEKPILDSICKRACDVYMIQRNSFSQSMINYM